MRYQQATPLFGVLLALSTGLRAAPPCPDWVATVQSVQGNVEAQPQSRYGDPWLPARVGDYLCPGAIVRAGKLSRATLRLRSETLLSMDQNSALTLSAKLNKIPPRWLVRMLDGLIFLRSRQPYPLEVSTPFLNGIHRGTEFAVAVDKQQASIFVLDGQVEASNAQGQVNIDQGFIGLASAGQAPHLQPLAVTPVDAVQWALYYPPIIDTSVAAQADPVLQQAIAAYQQGDLPSSINRLGAAQSPAALALKASLLLSVGRVDAAEPIIQQLLVQGSHKSSALALQAVIAVSKNQQEAALALSKQAVSQDPASAAAQLALSYAQQARFDLDAALAATQKAVQLAPDNALAWARLAEMHLSHGNPTEALAAATAAQKLNPRLARTQVVLGFTALAQTDLTAARQAFQQALSLDPADPLVRLGIGLLNIREGDLETGRQDLETAVTLDPNNAVIRSYLGKTYYELRNKDYAGKELEIAKQMDSKDPTPWFYDAILKQTTNRPVEALQDMQQAIALNDNRGVYRSRLLLDKDQAARQAGLGRIYNNLGFDDPANRLAVRSLATDPSNYSAHRLLSDSYAIKPRHEMARASEHFQAQLLQPLNYNPIQPSLAYTDLNIIRGVGPTETAFNEYNRLFERNGVRFTTTGMGGSNGTLGDEAALSGIHDKFSFSLGQLHYHTDGFRQNNGLRHNLYNAFAQYEVSPALNMQAEYRHRETEHGDLQLQGNIDEFDANYQRRLKQDTYRYGLKISPAQHSDILVSLLHANRTETLTQSAGGGIANFFLTTQSYDFEAQYLFHNDFMSTIAGMGVFRTDNYRDTQSTRPGTSCPCFSDYNTTQYFGYLYNNFKVFDNLNITAGVSYDKYIDNDSDFGLKVNELNPKLGLVWKLNQYLSFRMAGYKSVKSAIVDNQILQPIQIAGFNQFYDDYNGTVAWQYAVGLDSHVHQNLYAGLEAYKRDLGGYYIASEELYRLYLNLAVKDNLALNAEFRFENFRGIDFFPKFVETAYVPVEVRYFHKTGFFTALKGTYVDQKMNSGFDDPAGDFKSDFYLVDASIGYRLPKQYGLISFEAKNLFDTHFNYRDRQFQMNEQRSSEFIPERVLYARITLNF